LRCRAAPLVAAILRKQPFAQRFVSMCLLPKYLASDRHGAIEQSRFSTLSQQRHRDKARDAISSFDIAVVRSLH
jgi:hypothetical protein